MRLLLLVLCLSAAATVSLAAPAPAPPPADRRVVPTAPPAPTAGTPQAPPLANPIQQMRQLQALVQALQAQRNSLADALAIQTVQDQALQQENAALKAAQAPPAGH